MRILVSLALVVGMAGCTANTLISTAYPDRETFKFRNSDGDEVNSYACEKGATPEATKARAAKAHAHFDAGIEAIGVKYAEQLINGGDTGRITKGIGTEAEALVEATETRFQCLFFDSNDI